VAWRIAVFCWEFGRTASEARGFWVVKRGEVVAEMWPETAVKADKIICFFLHF
jgi:hypothetical protein